MTNTVKLDVGGTVFKTSKSTLTNFDGYFRTMFETSIPIIKDDSDAIFIDRDPKHFRLILNFMRDGHVVLPNVPEDVGEIQKEAEYYLLDGLVELCVVKLKLDNENEIAQKSEMYNLREELREARQLLQWAKEENRLRNNRPPTHSSFGPLIKLPHHHDYTHPNPYPYKNPPYL